MNTTTTMHSPLNLFKKLSYLVLAFLSLGIFSQCTNEQKTTEKTDSVAVVPEEPHIGEIIKTKSFEVKAFGVDTLLSIVGDNQVVVFAENKKDKYVTVDAEYKNILTVPAQIADGELSIKSDNKEEKFDKMLVVLATGFGSSLETVVPGGKRRAKMIYKVPRHLVGTASWKADSTSKAIEIGKVN